MSIVYFPDRVYKKYPPAIDRVMAKRNPLVVRGAANVTSTALDTVISANDNWQVNSIKLTFNSATSKNYSVKIMSGVKIKTNLNDYLWFQTQNSLWQKITLGAGFYTGTELATELQTKLNANTSFIALGITFTVVYSAITGLFTITPSSGTMRYIHKNNTQQLSARDSIAGHLFGLNVDSSWGATVVSDAAVYGLNEEAWIIDETANTDTEHYHDDLHILSLDQALHLETNVCSMIINYEVQYEEMV